MRFVRNLIAFIIILVSFSNYSLANTNSSASIDIYAKAPYFQLEGYSAKKDGLGKWEINDFKGSWLVLYFYPKDFTQGCTIEGKGFERISKELKGRNITIAGVSNDSSSDHKEFCIKEDLNFLLLSDKKGEISKAYDSWNEPFSKRNTFLINPEGLIVYKWNDVNPSTHPNDVLKLLNQKLQT